MVKYPKVIKIEGFGPKRRPNPRATRATAAINQRARKIAETAKVKKTLDDRLRILELETKIEEILILLKEKL